MTTERLLTDTVSVPEAIVRVLEQAGIDTVFGIPGGRPLAIYDALLWGSKIALGPVPRSEG